MHRKFGQKNLTGRHQLEDLGIDERILLEQVFEKYDSKAWTRWI
jgi:hypothetical protein